MQINKEQKVYVTQTGNYYTTYGFETIQNHTKELLKRLNKPQPENLNDITGTQEAYELFHKLVQEYSTTPASKTIYFNFETPEKCRKAIQNIIHTKQKVTIHYGDPKTNTKWDDTITGTISNSMGPMRIPILLKTGRSKGGEALLDHCILKITDKKTNQVIYAHN